VSSSALQSLHSAVSHIFLPLSILAVGIEFKARRQQNILTLDGNFIFHSCFHSFCLLTKSEQLAVPSN